MLYNNIASILLITGEFQDSLTYALKAKKILENETSCSNEDLLGFYHNFATILQKTGNNKDSLEYFQKCQFILEETPTSNQLNLASLYHNLGMLYFDEENFKEAKTYYMKSKEILEGIDRVNNPGLISLYNNLAILFSTEKLFDEALDYYKKCKDLMMKLFPSNHPDLAVLYNNIGCLYKLEEKFEESLIYYTESQHISKRFLPADHLYLGMVYNNIATILTILGYYNEANLMFLNSKKILKKNPSSNKFLAELYLNLASLQQTKGNYEKSLDYYLKSKIVLDKVLSTDHSTLGKLSNNLGGLFAINGIAKLSDDSFLESNRIIKKTLAGGNMDNEILLNEITLNKFASLLQVKGKDDEASKCLEILKNHNSLTELEAAIFYNNAGILFHKKNDIKTSFKYYRQCIKIRRKLLASDHLDLAIVYNNYASLLSEIPTKQPKAVSYFSKCEEIFRKTLPPNHPEFAYLYNNLALFYQSQGKYDNALCKFEESKKIIEEVFPNNHPFLISLINNMGLTFYYQGKIPEMIRYYLKSEEILSNVIITKDLDLGIMYGGLAIRLIMKDPPEYFFICYNKFKEILKDSYPTKHSNLDSIYEFLKKKFNNKEPELNQLIIIKNETTLYNDYQQSLANPDVIDETIINQNYNQKNQNDKSLLFKGIFLEIKDIKPHNNIPHEKKFNDDYGVNMQEIADNEYKLLTKLYTENKIYFLKPYSIKNMQNYWCIEMENFKCSFYDIKKEILDDNKIMFGEREMKILLQQVLEAYKILRKLNIVHSDITPGKILIGFDDKIKLYGFGHSFIYEHEIISRNEPEFLPSQFNNDYFISPELHFWRHSKLAYMQERLKYNPFKSAIFSIGLCILYTIDSDIKYKYEDNL